MPIRFKGSARPRRVKSPDPGNMPLVRENIVPRIFGEVAYFKANGEMPQVPDPARTFTGIVTGDGTASQYVDFGPEFAGEEYLIIDQVISGTTARENIIDSRTNATDGRWTHDGTQRPQLSSTGVYSIAPQGMNIENQFGTNSSNFIHSLMAIKEEEDFFQILGGVPYRSTVPTIISNPGMILLGSGSNVNSSMHYMHTEMQPKGFLNEVTHSVTQWAPTNPSYTLTPNEFSWQHPSSNNNHRFYLFAHNPAKKIYCGRVTLGVTQTKDDANYRPGLTFQNQHTNLWRNSIDVGFRPKILMCFAAGGGTTTNIRFSDAMNEQAGPDRTIFYIPDNPGASSVSNLGPISTTSPGLEFTDTGWDWITGRVNHTYYIIAIG